MAPKSHDKIAEQLQKALNTPYNRGKGVDFQKGQTKVEVEPTPNTFSDGIKQLRNYKGLRYLSTDESFINDAIRRTQNTKIGVMKPNGAVVKPATPARRNK